MHASLKVESKPKILCDTISQWDNTHLPNSGSVGPSEMLGFDLKSKVLVMVSPHEQHDEPSILTTSSMLKSIHGALGLAVTDYAKIFNVKRATYYNWIKDKTDPDSEEAIERIKSIFHVAERVSVFNRFSYGRKAKTYTYDGDTLLSLLCESRLNTEKIISLCQKLTTILKSREANSPSNTALKNKMHKSYTSF